jgi:hypothetical protein
MTHAQSDFKWEDSEGNSHSLAELEEILRKHAQWLQSGGRAGIQVNLNGAKFDDMNLSGANLSHLNLTMVSLFNANVTNADLRGADLDGAHMTNANLSGAKLVDANLTDGNLSGANLNGTYVGGANLTNASLRAADLKGAYFDGTNLDRAVFEPKSLPELREIAAAENLELLTYDTNPDALVQLRKQFGEEGFREQERKITYALKRRETEWAREKCMSRTPTRFGRAPRAIVSSSDSVLANCGSFALNRVFFDWTCQYGMSPGRPLILGLLLWLLCSLLYFGFIHTSGESGLYRVYGKGVRDAPSAPQRVEKISLQCPGQSPWLRRLIQFFWRECLLLRTSMFFSLMSAFNIGFRDINFGRWLRLLTRQEFDIKAVGWARVVAGWQSLISVYLIALWVLTYFGRPFG